MLGWFGLTTPINFITTIGRTIVSCTTPAVVEMNSGKIRFFQKCVWKSSIGVMPTLKNSLRAGFWTSGLTSYRMSILIHRHVIHVC